EGSTTWAQGLPVVMRCHEILKLYGIPDVHCEIRESHFSYDASSPADTPPASEPTFVREAIDSPHSLIKTRALWSEYLGLSIASSNRPTREGTKGLYLRLKGSGKIVALTCRHVLFEEPKPEFRHVDGDTQPCTVMQPGDETLNEHKELISWKLEGAPQAIKNLEREMLQQRRDALPVLERTERDLRRLDDPENRIFGHVIYAPELSKGRTDTGGDRLRDWALIELHPEKFASSLDELRNQVFVGDDDDVVHLLIRAVVAEGIKKGSGMIMWSNAAWLEEDTIPETEMRKVSEEAGSLDDDPTIAVAKYGSSTGLTAGFANGIKSLIRHPVDGMYVHSEEWRILDSKQHGNSNDRRDNFSWRGDSGACVWGGRCRVGGILTGGNGGRLGGFDISYATPMEWLLDDIKAHGYDVELITGWR
ncbi:hypothetical protein FDECE_18650, partial [Fusarium decemcellulare]